MNLEKNMVMEIIKIKTCLKTKK